MKGMRKFFMDGGGSVYLSLSYYSPDVDARWTIDDDGAGSLQIVYDRKGLPDSKDENFWLYLAPQDARVLGSVLLAYAAAHGEGGGDA